MTEVASLKGMRLGVLERTVLCNAPIPGSLSGLEIRAPERTRSAQQAYLRATKKLKRAGLVRPYSFMAPTRARDPRRESPLYMQGRFVERPDPTRRQMVQRVFVWSTPLGEGVKFFYETELTRGKAIRWTDKKLKLIQRYAEGNDVLDAELQTSIEAVEMYLRVDEDDDGPTFFKEVFPETKMTKETTLRWRSAVKLARREHPTLGHANLWREAKQIYGSSEETAELTRRSGPVNNADASVANGIRFRSEGMFGNFLTPAGANAKAKSTAK